MLRKQERIAGRALMLSALLLSFMMAFMAGPVYAEPDGG